MQLKFIHEGGMSKRYHTMPVVKEQTIAAHSFGVAWFCELLTQGQASKNLIMAALAHDLAEHMVGDIPSPVKREMDIRGKFEEYEMKHLRTAGLATYDDELMEGERFTLKMADMLDGMMYCVQEARLGNKTMGMVYQRFNSYAVEVLRQYGAVEVATSWTFNKEVAEHYLEEINNEWRKAL